MSPARSPSLVIDGVYEDARSANLGTAAGTKPGPPVQGPHKPVAYDFPTRLPMDAQQVRDVDQSVEIGVGPDDWLEPPVVNEGGADGLVIWNREPRNLLRDFAFGLYANLVFPFSLHYEYGFPGLD